jgi:hypothetical protein
VSEINSADTVKETVKKPVSEINSADTVKETVKDKIMSKLSIIKKFSSNIPDRTKIFLSALWFWAYILYFITKVLNVFLCVFITYTPDSFLIFRPRHTTDNKIPEILEAKLNNDVDISNKLNMLLNWKWDGDIGDSGGIRIRDMVEKYKSISTSIVWISYLFEIDKKLESMSDADIGKSIKYMLVNINEKVLYRDADLKIPEDILFGEIPFD